MRRALVVVLLLLVVLIGGVTVPSLAPTASASPAPPHAHDEPARFRDGVVLVAFDGGVSVQNQHQAEAAANAHEVRTLGVGVHVLSVPDGQVADAVRLLSAYPGVRYAEPDYLSHAAGVTPNDPSFPIQWADQNTGQSVNGTAGTPGDDESTVAAWKVTTGSRNIVIGEADTGIEYTHPDLAANIWTNPGGIGGCPAGTHGYNVLAANCDPMDDETTYGGHGTHVAGIMGAVGNNGIGVTGVNWKTTILPVKWVDSSDSGSTSDLIAGLDWLLKAKQAGVNIRVVNDSEVFFGTAYSQALSDEIALLGQNNILFVTAAGNTADDNDDPAVRRYPCGYDLPTEICVAASDQNDALPTSWANYGPATVDLAAPGNNIYSTIRGATYGYVDGSSMASPQVAGAAALILSVQDMPAAQLKADLLENVDLVPGLSGRVRTGGRLDICKALPGCTSPVTQATGTFGQRSVGANSDVLAAGRPLVNRYQLATNASVSKLSIYLQPTSTSGQQSVEGVIYADQGGVPGALLGMSTPLTHFSPQQAAWYDLPFASPIALASGTYWIGVLSGGTDGVVRFRWTSVPTVGAFTSNSSSGAASDPSGAAMSAGRQISLYATYTYTPVSRSPAPFAVTPPHVTMTGQGGFFTPQPGQTLSSDGGMWDRNPTGYAYQWLRCNNVGEGCSAIAGATSPTYVPTNADGDSTLRVSITASNAAGATTSDSAPTQIVPAAAPSSTFGKTTIGASSDPSGSNAERVQVYPVGQAVSVSKLTVYLKRNSSGQQVLKGLIYADQGGVPGSLLATSVEVTFGTSATDGWYDLPFASPVALAAGSYWIGLIDGASPNVFAIAYDNGPANASDLIYPTYTNGPPNPFGSGWLQTEQMSIYATYTVNPSTVPAAKVVPSTVSGTATNGTTTARAGYTGAGAYLARGGGHNYSVH